MNKFKESTVVITGAGSGIGRALAIAFADRGANLALSDIDLASLEQTKQLINNQHIKVELSELDVSNKTAMFDYAEQVHSAFGQINLVINNAGVALRTGPFDNTTLDEFEWLMGINFSGVLYGCKAFLPYLQQAQWSHIVNVSSLFGIIGVPGQTAYNASKFAVRGLSEALRQELELAGSNVSCTCVHPGGVKTSIARNSRGKPRPPQKGDLFAGDPEDFEKMARTTPKSAAEQIIKAVEKNQRRVLVGGDAKLMDWVQRHFPVSYPRILNWLAARMTK